MLTVSLHRGVFKIDYVLMYCSQTTETCWKWIPGASWGISPVSVVLGIPDGRYFKHVTQVKRTTS